LPADKKKERPEGRSPLCGSAAETRRKPSRRAARPASCGTARRRATRNRP
jgi:hypothetical protein